MHLRKPYLLFLGAAASEPYAKTALGLRDWCPDDVVGQYRLPGCNVDLGLPGLTPTEAAARGARSFVIGAAPIGGRLPEDWMPVLQAALAAGLDLVSGLHDRLCDYPELVDLAQQHGRSLHDVRTPEARPPIATGRRRTGKRLLTVGTDCALGKKYTALAITSALQERGITATFRATGQTGIMIAGQGVPLDAVVADFAAGAAEALSPDNQPEHWDVVEGQGSLFHPAYAGVSLALLHGSQPDGFVLCHDPLRRTIEGFPDYPIPDLGEAIERYRLEGALTSPAIRCEGLSVNTSKLTDSQRDEVLGSLRERFGLPVFDPLRSDLQELITRLVSRCRSGAAA